MCGMAQWLKAVDCPLLQPNAESDPLARRLVQRLLEIARFKTGSDELAKALLEEIAFAVRAEQAGVWEATPQWQPRWQTLRRGTRGDTPARTLLGEVLDQQAGISIPP